MIVDKSNDNKVVIEQLNLLVNKFKLKLILSAFINVFPWLIVLLVIGYSLYLPLSLLVIFFLLTSYFTVIIVVRSARYQQVTLSKLLLHLNRHHPQLQESAHLVNGDKNSFTILQTLQNERVVFQLQLLLTQNKQSLLPKISYRKSILSFILASLMMLVIYFSNLWWPLLHSNYNELNRVNEFQKMAQKNVDEILITNSQITIMPPIYTQLKVREQKELNASVIIGSIVRWQLALNFPIDNVFIQFSNGEKVQLNHQNKHSYTVEKPINFTGIYHFGFLKDGVEQILSEIYTLEVIKDNKAKIRFVTPKNTITAIATNADTLIETHVKITDDFHVDKVEILASIAKGSGESVKFRDQIFKFDTQDVIDGIHHYYKSWDLEELRMEPGDELYFTVKAWDNRQPEGQLTRSTTKIIRWLEDEPQAVLSDGILIDFMPEYFKSQRQIIIETIDLINDRAELHTDQFIETSELLGVAQSELKEKYGQYLGDEVEDGGGSHAISHEASEQISVLAEADSSSENDHHHEDSGGHGNDIDTIKGFGTDRSGSSQVISQFGHNHEDADIGIMARQDPKALMKRSIASMWKAELHLMLSEPSKALPFEEEALKYLKMAKKAERIYVKRLGFEPPPVNEQRRYQGELDDIFTYKQQQVNDLTNNEKMLLSNLFSWLNSEVNRPISSGSSILTPTQRQLIIKVKMQFEQLLDSRPALVKYVAIFEQALLSNNLQFKRCTSCLMDLTEKIWQILPSVTAKPFSPRKTYTESDILFIKYSDFLSEQP